MSWGADDRVVSLRAVAHPVRLQMLSLLTGTEMSAAEVARELGVTHANASYHLRVLADAGELVVAGEAKIPGGVSRARAGPRTSASTSGRWPTSWSAGQPCASAAAGPGSPTPRCGSSPR